ncbi:hypothetical protein OS493_019446 [Desmophyllum pertusum]|uniref:Uncharacterized protein n=1 Tax=Desmophyllum pertusum TaxID=174260 RepID=A0A9X0A1T6_9CNID|nr:hypothetical protein OS493_019446 [Desmophyllum pertusum]
MNAANFNLLCSWANSLLLREQPAKDETADTSNAVDILGLSGIPPLSANGTHAIVYPLFVMDEANFSVKRSLQKTTKGFFLVGSRIQDLVKFSISDLKRSSESIASQQMSEIKGLKQDSALHFNKKSNKEQYKANKTIKEAVEDVQNVLEHKDFQNTKEAEALDKGMVLLLEQQKLILLADKSLYSWKTASLSSG